MQHKDVSHVDCSGRKSVHSKKMNLDMHIALDIQSRWLRALREKTDRNLIKHGDLEENMKKMWCSLGSAVLALYNNVAVGQKLREKLKQATHEKYNWKVIEIERKKARIEAHTLCAQPSQ